MRRVDFQIPVLCAVVLLCALPRAVKADNTHAGAASGESVFQANCSMCHGGDGSGSAVGKSLHAPDLRSARVQTQSTATLAHFISEGNGAMPAFKNTLDHQQILDEVRYIRSLGKHHAAR